MIEHEGPISGIATFGDRLVATAGYDNQIILWDSRERRALARGCHDHLVNQCEFSADGKWLVSSSSDCSARLWSVGDMRLAALLTGHDDDVEGVAFDPAGERIATTSRDHSLIIFDRRGRILRRLTGHRSDVLSVAWLDGGRSLTSSSDDGTIRRWDAATGALIETIEFDGVETDTVAIAGDGTLFAGNDRGELIVIRGGRRERIAAHAAGIKRIVYDERAGRLVTLSYDRSARFWAWNGRVARPLQRSSLPALVWPRACAFQPGGRVVFATFGSRYATLDLASGEWDLDGIGLTGGINAACFHSGGVYTVGDAGIVRQQGREVARLGSLCNFIHSFGDALICGGQMGDVISALDGEILHRHHSPLNCAARFDAGGIPALIVGSYTGEGLVFHWREGGPRFVGTMSLHDNAVKGLAASGDSLFSVCATGAAAIHDLATGERLLDDRTSHGRIANGCAALPDGRFVSVSRDLRLRVWDGATVRSFASPHRNSIKCCAASGDGRIVATGDYGGRVCLFDVTAAAYGEAIRLSAAGISSLVAIPGEQAFLATCYDGSLQRVDAGARVSRLAA